MLRCSEDDAETEEHEVRSGGVSGDGRMAGGLIGGTRYYAACVDMGIGELSERALVFAHQIRGVACLAAVDKGKVRLVVACDLSLTERYPADLIVSRLAALVGGTGRGDARIAAGFGERGDRIQVLLESFPHVLESVDLL
jgi:alanyl-tRNA synthetase